MLGTGDHGHDDGDLDPRRLAAVLLVAAALAAGVGAGMWITTAERPVAETSVVNVPRPRHDRVTPPPAGATAPSARTGPGQSPSEPLGEQPVAPAPPHPVDVPVLEDPGPVAG
ncbi:hypothetical protein D7D52_11090 [Nocardia yunnanensis]|uniref:Uncharacterized protein n=1 Tax=Nocardia yunnanensis TaxID=2382165 RepID=A0A386ZCT9_9NOCA|nr:hypothetical protein [Nocardia yunnanensis]AYF74319.1 hypothetical protein D7D52_11090 [Nocardia yunnanensis]